MMLTRTRTYTNTVSCITLPRLLNFSTSRLLFNLQVFSASEGCTDYNNGDGVHGSHPGYLLENAASPNADSCIEQCFNTPGCVYATYYATSTHCSLFKTCTLGPHVDAPTTWRMQPSTDLTWTVYGSMFAPLGATNGVVLGTYRTTDMAVIQPTGATAKFITVGPLTSRTAYRYHWVHAVDNSGSTGNSHTVGECEFYQHTKDSLFQISEGDVVTFNRVKGQTSLWVNGALALTYPFVSTADMRFAVSSHGWGYVVVVVVVVVHAVFVTHL